jgi:hypothetical protein
VIIVVTVVTARFFVGALLWGTDFGTLRARQQFHCPRKRSILFFDNCVLSLRRSVNETKKSGANPVPIFGFVLLRDLISARFIDAETWPSG